MRITVLYLVVLLCVTLGYCEIKWFQCPLFTNNPIDLSSNETTTFKLVPDDTLRIECAHISLPLDYSNTSDTNIVRIFIKRLYNKNFGLGTNNQLWFFPGGTGGDSSGIEPWMYRLYGQIGDKFELYTIDPRGTGRSDRLTCLNTQAETIGSDDGIIITMKEYIECVKVNPDYLRKFSVTNAALDIINIMEKVTSPTQKVFIYGLSYGTFLANRFFQIFTSTKSKLNLSGIILDSVVNSAGPLRTTIDQWAPNMDQVARTFFDKCSNNTFCSSKLTGNALKFVQDTLNTVFSTSSSCSRIAESIDRKTLVIILGNIMTSSRDIVPAIIYRLNRCNSVIDVPVLLRLIKYSQLWLNPKSCIPLYSPFLMYNLLSSDMYPSQVDLAKLEHFLASEAIIGGTLGIDTVRIKQQANWPTYSTDQYWNQPIKSDTTVPVLLLNGDLDIITPLFSTIAQLENLQIPNKRLIEIPNAPHGTFMLSPVIGQDGKIEHLSCAEQMGISFLLNPDLNKINTTCLDHLAPLSLSWNNSLAISMLGVADIYEDAYGEPYMTASISLNIALGVCAGTMATGIVIIASMYYYFYEKRLDKQRKGT